MEAPTGGALEAPAIRILSVPLQEQNPNQQLQSNADSPICTKQRRGTGTVNDNKNLQISIKKDRTKSLKRGLVVILAGSPASPRLLRRFSGHR